MFKKIKFGELGIILFVLAAVVFIYRDFFFRGKIVFSSNFLATFYSPWTTHQYPGYPNGIPNKPIGGNDNVRMFYPYRTFINESLKAGELPLWNPYNFSGSPLLADFQSAVFYPLNLIYFFLPQITAWSILVIIQPLLGTLFMYLYLRLFISQKSAAFLGAIAFGFSGFILVWSQENAVVGQASIWFPLILYGTEKFVSTNSLKYYVLLVAGLASCILAGFLQVTFYIFFVSILYGIFRIRSISKKKKGTLLFLVSAYLLSLMICAVQIIPSIEAFFQSARSTSSIQSVLETYLLPLRYYLRVLSPDIFGNPATYNYFGKGFYHESIFYLGIIPLVFVILAMSYCWKNKIVRFFIWVSAVSFFLGVKSPFTDWFYRLPIPLVNTFTPSRIFFVTSTALAVISAYGFSHWLENNSKKSRKTTYLAAGTMIGILIFIAVFYYLSVITNNKNLLVKFVCSLINPHEYLGAINAVTTFRNIIPQLFMLFALIVLTIFRNKFRFGKIIILILLCLGQFYFLNKYVVLGYREFLYPDHFIFADIQASQNKADRFISFGLPVASDVGIEKHIFSPDGIDPVFPKRYGQLIYAAKNKGLYTMEIPRIEVMLSEYSGNYKEMLDGRLFKIMSLLGVTHVYNFEKDYKNPEILGSLFVKEMFKPLWNREGWQVYENTQALPRAFLAENYLVETDPQKILDLMFDRKTDLRKTVILEEVPPNISLTQKSADLGTSDEVVLEVYKPSFVQLQVETDRDKILFLSDNYYPGWKAKIDNLETKIYRADFTFRGIVVPKGKHTIIFSFEPFSLKIGAIISGSAIFLLLSIVCFRRFNQRNNPPDAVSFSRFRHG